MARPSKDQYFMSLAVVAAGMSTCIRRNVGCVLVNDRGRVLAVNYNGVASGQPHCNEPAGGSLDVYMDATFPNACRGWGAPTGQDGCEGLHAEMNALAWCREPEAVHAAYVTVRPCERCVKALLGTPCRHIYYLEDFDGRGGDELWRKAGRVITRLRRTDDGRP